MLRVLFLAALALLCVNGTAWAQQGRWYRAETANFIVYGDRNAEQTAEAAIELEDFDETLRRLTNAPQRPPGAKLEVYLFRNNAQLNEIRAAGETIRGFYIAGGEQMAAFVVYVDVAGAARRNQILFHEYAHHFMLHYFPHAYPRWYVEGWAEWVSTAEIRDRRATVGIPSPNRGNWLVSGPGFLPMVDLLAPERTRRRNPDFWGQYYAHAWFAAMYVTNTPERMRGLQRYVLALGEGQDPIEAFEPSFGVTQDAFEQELMRFRRARVPTLAVQLSPQAPQVTVTRLPLAADDLLLPLARVRTGVPYGAEASTAQTLEQAAQRHPGAPMAELALARAALLREDYAGARPRLEALIAAEQAVGEARYLLAVTYIEEARGLDNRAAYQAVLEARRQLARGFRANPDHYPTLYLYASTFSGGVEPMAEEQLNVLGRALELAPQASVVRLLLAEELMQSGEFDAAIIILRPLIYAPHGGQEAAYARAMFDAARQRQQPPSRASISTEDEAAPDGEGG